MQRIGILGGTFDPIHFGHLRTALEALQQLNLDQVRFMPCHIPPHKNRPSITGEVRAEMVRLAITGQPGFVLDTRELAEHDTSYTINTLNVLRQEYGEQTTLVFLMGMDSWLNFYRWHQWRQFPEFAHLLVVPRPGYNEQQLAEEQRAFFHQRYGDWQQQQHQPAGSVQFLATSEMAISSSNIREQIRNNRSPRYLLPDAVWHYIEHNRLYRPQGGNEPTDD